MLFVYTKNNMSVKDAITARLLGNSERFSDKQVSDTLQLLVAHGVRRGANAIHLEPHDRFVLARYRIDGVLRGIHKLPPDAAPVLIKKLKQLADLDPNETNRPQEGHYMAEAKGRTIGVRVATMPVLGGEKAVLHLAATTDSPGSLQELGFWGANLEALHLALAHPHGLITVAGPKHSGKSTTLYAMLELLNNPTHSIATIEEHATRQLPGASQTYVHARSGTTLFDALQAVLHQDPNIIMIGNLPTKATAELAIHSAVTGQLLLTEVYADGAVTSALHLRAQGIEPFLLVSALKLCIGQRLARRICPTCRERYALTETERRELEKQFGLTTLVLPKLNELERQAKQAGLGGDQPLNTNAQAITHLWRAKNGGCNDCDRTGFQGRIALTEVLTNGELIQKQLLKHDMPTVSELHKTALKSGFIPIGLDGLVKALRGETSAFEVLRAIGTSVV